MKILLTAPFEEPVPPRKYGGTELVVAQLAREYSALGHEVHLLASGDSKTPAKLHPVVSQAIRLMPEGRSVGKWREFWKYTGIARMLSVINSLKPDIIHNNYNWRVIAFEDVIKYPMMSTLHGPLTDITETETYNAHSNHPYISISYNQRKAMPGINWVGTVYNGIEIDTFPYNKSVKDREYFIFLGRTSPEKGLAEIVKIISETDQKLVIAAKVDEVDKEYFESEVKPFIDGEKISFVGEVDHKGKTELLLKAKALLLWLNWEEPFGLVVPEANACGTPVIVNKRGSMPELIENGVNGYLVSSLEEMRDKMAEVDKLLPENCRKRVGGNYTARIMAENYLSLADKVIKKYAKS